MALDTTDECKACRPSRIAAGQDPAKRKQILDGARRVFSQMGFDAASMNDITREAGVSKGTIYVWAPVPEGHTSTSFAELVLEEAAVVVSPGSMYGPSGEGFFRISLTAPDERITEAVERMREHLA